MTVPNAVAPLRRSLHRTRDTIVVAGETEHQIVHEARAGIVLFRYEGWTTTTHWESARAMMEASIARAGSIAIITNGLDCAGYEPDVREAWWMWCSQFRKQIRTQHFLARSPMLRMGVQTMSMLSRTSVKLYRELYELEAAVAAECPGVDLAPIRARPAAR